MQCLTDTSTGTQRISPDGGLDSFWSPVRCVSASTGPFWLLFLGGVLLSACGLRAGRAFGVVMYSELGLIVEDGDADRFVSRSCS